MFYKVEGNIKDISSVKYVAEDLLPMDVGTQGSTDFVFDESVPTYMMENNLLVHKYGLIHSHNNMGVFFSGTDNQELQDNAENHNNYLSLIVNNRMDMCAKVAIVGREVIRQSSFEMIDGDGDKYTVKQDPVTIDCIFTYDCKIIKPAIYNVDKTFMDRVTEIGKKKTVQPKFDFSKKPLLNNTASDTDLEKFLIKFFDGKKTDNLDSVLQDLKYTDEYGALSLLTRYANYNKNWQWTDVSETKLITNVLKLLSPYEWDNLIELKEDYTACLEENNTGTINFNQMYDWY